MKEKEQSSIEWLIQHIKMLGEAGYDYNEAIDILSKEAKELHKKEIVEAWNIAHQAGRFEGKGIAEENWQTFEQYYNEKYGQ